MKFSIEHAREFVRILDKPDLKPEGIEPDGNFKFGFKGAKTESQIIVDPGMIASVIQLKKLVDRGQAQQEQLQSQIAQIIAELKI